MHLRCSVFWRCGSCGGGGGGGGGDGGGAFAVYKAWIPECLCHLFTLLNSVDDLTACILYNLGIKDVVATAPSTVNRMSYIS